MKVLVVIFMKKHRLGFPKIGRDLQIEFRGSRYCARKVAYFRHFKTKSGNRITGILYVETLRVWLKSRAVILGGCSVNLCYDMECAHLLWNVLNFNLSTTSIYQAHKTQLTQLKTLLFIRCKECNSQ